MPFRVSRPVRMYGRTVVMLRRMVIRMGVDERSADGRSLQSHRDRSGEYPSHDASLLEVIARRVKPARPRMRYKAE